MGPQRPLSPFRSVIAFPISSPSAALDWGSTRSHTRSPRRRLSSHSLMPCVLLLYMTSRSCVFFPDFHAVSSTVETRVSSSYLHLDICSVRKSTDLDISIPEHLK